MATAMMFALISFVICFVVPIALAPHSRYFMKIALAIDILGSAWLNGLPGETLSGRAGTAYRQGKLRGRIFAPIIDVVMRKRGHCLGAIEGDILRARAVIADDQR